jgi:hypothetical protein
MKNATLHTKIERPLVDSKEVLEDYYIGRILQLEMSLNRLNLLEHPVEIRSICAKIISIKNMLNRRVPLKKR